MPNGQVAKDDFGKPFIWPRWYIFLWAARDNRFYRINILETADKDYFPLDHRTVRALRSDIIRVKGLKKAISYRAEMREKEKEAKLKKLTSDRSDWSDINEHKIREAMDNPHHRYATHRTVKTFGFEGQKTKDTSGKLVKKTPTELGWENSPIEGEK